MNSQAWVSTRNGYMPPAITAEEAQAWHDVQATPVMGWVWKRGSEAINVSVAFSQWPEVTVMLKPHGAPRIGGVFDAVGVLRLLQFDAEFPSRGVQAGDLRHLPAISTLKAWEVPAREYGRQIAAGAPPKDIVFDTSSPAAALRSLSKAAKRKPGARARAAEAHELLLRKVADEYRQATGSRAPRKVVAERLGYSEAHISRLLTETRRAADGRGPLLGPGRGGGRRPGKRP